jgi:hypothetical protein
MDANRAKQSTETRVLIIKSAAKGEAFLHFIYKLLQVQELMTWNDGSTPLSKFKLHLRQGCYQIYWQEIFDVTDPNDDRNMKFFTEQVQNILRDVVAKDKWSEMANYICTRCKKPRLMTTKQV